MVTNIGYFFITVYSELKLSLFFIGVWSKPGRFIFSHDARAFIFLLQIKKKVNNLESGAGYEKALLSSYDLQILVRFTFEFGSHE